MKYFFLSILITPLMLFSKQRLELKEEISLSAGKLTLKEVALIEGFSVKGKKHIESIVLAEKIQAGEMRKFSSQAITDVIRKEIPRIRKMEIEAGEEFSLTLKLPKVFIVYVNSPQWTEKTLSEKISEANQKFCKECSFQVEHLRLPNLKYEKVSRWTLEKPQELIKGSFRLAIQLHRHEQQSPQTYYVTGRVSAYRDFPVARRNIPLGERVFKDDVVFEKRKWNFIRKDIPTQAELFGGKLKRMALSGGVIWLSNIEREKAIERGQLVDLIVKKKDWEIRLKGVAQESGMIGDTVSVLNRKSKKVVVGKVVANKEVAVQ